MDKFNYNLKTTLYFNEYYDAVDDSPDYCNNKLEAGWKLFARKGQLAKRIEITDEIREEYSFDNIYNYMYQFKNGYYVLFQNDDLKEELWFEKVNKGDK